MSPQPFHMILPVVFSMLLLVCPLAHADETSEHSAQTILHMLDYVSVDYGRAVPAGVVLNEDEFKEQVEFANQSMILLGKLPVHVNQPALLVSAQELLSSVQSKVPPEHVRDAAQKLRRSIIEAYQVPISPKRAPDLLRAETLYKELCVACHGVAGHGDGPAGHDLEPKPSNFHDTVRMSQRSVYGLYNTISLGVGGTGMTGFTQLSENDRWSLAFYVSNLHASTEDIAKGRKLWDEDKQRSAVPNLLALTNLTGNEIAIRHGEQSKAVLSYLRSNPQVLVAVRQSSLQFSIDQLSQALASYRSGDQLLAQQLAISAYLEGFEPQERGLDNLDSTLRLGIEKEMMAVRQLMREKAPVETVAASIALVTNMLEQANVVLRDNNLSYAGAFVSALFILLREGLEAILVLAAIITFVIKSGQRKALVYIHAGWGGALLLGAITWAVATWLVNISGANREITEGVTALIASAMLIYVGYWLHDKAHAQSWKTFLRNQVGAALEKKTLWSLALVSFFAVYREIFETVLFYQALWAQTNESTWSAIWAGMLAAVVLLAGIGWGLFRFGLKLPLGPFFSTTSLLLAVLAVIFAGQGVSALQEAGIINADSVNFVSLPILGIFPTMQTLLAQALVIGILLVCFYAPQLRQKKAI